MFSLCGDEISYCLDRLHTTFIATYPEDNFGYGILLDNTVSFTLNMISRSNAAYHDLSHTILATLTGQEILIGKHLKGEKISSKNWVHYLISLLCHDIGFIRGACRNDKLCNCCYSSGIDDHMIVFNCSHTDASLSPYHVDRSKRFVAEQFQGHPLLDVNIIQELIEFTRFPVPQHRFYQDTACYGGMTRSADLIGQLSDLYYLDKLPDLFAEFEETGVNQIMGYQHPDDMRREYPSFYRNVALPYIESSFVYLSGHKEGRLILDQLQRNVQIAQNIR